MNTKEENIIEQGDDFKISLFDLNEESATIPEIDKELEDEKATKPIVNQEPVEDEVTPQESTTDEDTATNPEENSEKSEVEDKPQENTELNEYEKNLSELISSGYMLLPEDYEYEPTKDGIAKAFEDSEKIRNEMAFKEAVNFLLSEDGIDYAKAQTAQQTIKSIDALDPEKMDADEKLDIVKQFYQIKGYDETEINDLVESIIDSDKIDAEFNLATKFIKKEQERNIASEAQRVQQERENAKKVYEESQKELKLRIEKTQEINGYQLTNKKDKIFDSTYKPVKLKDGTVTTDVNARLQYVLTNPDTYLVLVDLLLNMDDKGFNFSHIQKKAESEGVKAVKKTLRDLRSSDNKSKVSGKVSQTKEDFDLTKYSLFNFK